MWNSRSLHQISIVMNSTCVVSLSVIPSIKHCREQTQFLSYRQQQWVVLNCSAMCAQQIYAGAFKFDDDAKYLKSQLMAREVYIFAL